MDVVFGLAKPGVIVFELVVEVVLGDDDVTWIEGHQLPVVDSF